MTTDDYDVAAREPDVARLVAAAERDGLRARHSGGSLVLVSRSGHALRVPHRARGRSLTSFRAALRREGVRV
jgi:hypothetical protein